ncbi:hypothetical protein [Mesobacillus jeotgali]|uniref:hypothetical protein n=1 Tax=Mesobacillus jeotgali TaxID=129985 RepID=UPI001CFCBE76|nr:hypothetical protein [Mesobacillus jeotgali]
MDEFLFYLDAAIVMWFIAQISYSFLILILGNVMMEYYEWGTYESPSTVYQKTVNFIMGFLLIGVGPYIYKRLLKHPWWKRKLYMLGSVLVLFIGSIIFYEMLMGIVRKIF